MAGWLIGLLWVVYAVLFFVAYHKIFNVVYFDLGKGCLGEIISVVFGGMVMIFLWGSYWVVALIVTLVLLFIVFGLKREG